MRSFAVFPRRLLEPVIENFGRPQETAHRLPNGFGLYIDPAREATWRSGYATVCKTVYTSSILVVASIYLFDIFIVLS